MINARNLVHDLLNKLTYIQGEIIKEKKNKRGDWGKVQYSSELMVSLIKNFIKSERDNYICITNEEVFEYAGAWLKSTEILHDIKINIVSENNPLDKVYNDDPKMVAIFTNAVENSINAGATEFNLVIKRKKYFTEYSLIDNGKIMSDEEISSMGFGFTTDGSGKGSRFMRELAVSMEGWVTWEANPKGTTFIMRCRNGPNAEEC